MSIFSQASMLSIISSTHFIGSLASGDPKVHLMVGLLRPSTSGGSATSLDAYLAVSGARIAARWQFRK